jgi:hypothetical protein
MTRASCRAELHTARGVNGPPPRETLPRAFRSLGRAPRPQLGPFYLFRSARNSWTAMAAGTAGGLQSLIA